MLNRRYLRIKVLQALYAFRQSSESDPGRNLHEMFRNIEIMVELYLYLLQLIVEMKSLAVTRINEAHKKKLPNNEDINPNLKFVNNRMIRILSENDHFQHEISKRKISWEQDGHLLNRLFRELLDSSIYKNYMIQQNDCFEKDRELCCGWIKKIILPMDLIHSHFQSKNIYWYDDFFIVCFNILRTFKGIKEKSIPSTNILLPLYKNRKEDKEFTKRLFLKTIERQSIYTEIIAKKTQNWEIDRIALVDAILMSMAICETTKL